MNTENTKIDQVKDEIKKHFREYAEETGRPTGKILFNCFLEDHNDEDASMQFKDTYYKCYGCGKTLDIFSLYALDHNLNERGDFMQIKQELANKYNIDLKRPMQKPLEVVKPMKKKENNFNFTNYYKETSKSVEETDYFTKRGITKDIINKYNLGYDKKTKYAVLPVSKSFYMSRDTLELTEEERTKQRRLKHVIPKGASVEMFNKNLISDADFKSVIFITESILDALSLEVVDPTIKAIALNGKEHYLDVVEEAEKSNFKGYFVIALDNDPNKQGQKTSKELKEELDKRGFRNFVMNPYDKPTTEVYKGNKDINEYLLNDYESLKDTINYYDATLTNSLKKEAQKLLEQENALSYLGTFNTLTLDKEYNTPIKTDIARLDKGLYGGLFKKNLIILGASSGAGKTTLALQIADNVARQGQDALIFSLEMSKEELIAKSLSRLMFIADKKKNHYTTGQKCLSTRQILTGAMYEEKADKETQELYSEAYEDYRENIAKHVFINECNEDLAITIGEIEERIRRHIAVTEQKPLVVIDYLQIIENKEKGLTDIQATGKIVKDLKRLARKLEINIIVISAFNRSANTTDASYSSFRDTSTIEYTADVLLSLQLSVLDNADVVDEEENNGRYNAKKEEKKLKQKIKDANKQEVKRVTLKILKNRNGKIKDLSFIDFYAKNNYFDFLTYDGGKLIED